MKNARSGIERARFVDQFLFVITLSKAALGRGGDAGPSDGGQGHLPGLLHGYPPPVCGRGKWSSRNLSWRGPWQGSGSA